jgi:beta-aspartyl-peptidase (threonine type)
MPSLILHGGAGRMANMDAEREVIYRAALREAAVEGALVLRRGGSALDASVTANAAMEDSGVFNAGLGSVLTSDGAVEMDAAVMVGADRDIGAVCGIEGVANAIVVARHVMEHTPHCLLQGEGATRFARQRGLKFREGFPSEARIRDWSRRKAAISTGAATVESLGGVLGDDRSTTVARILEQDSGLDVSGDTVGAAACDAEGRLVAGVTTGGVWMKMPGRVGDVPMPGAGYWAVDGQGAAIGTGFGETILRTLLTREVVDRMADGPTAACQQGIDLLEGFFGKGQAGVIALSATGAPGYAVNTAGMGRAFWAEGMDEPAVAVWPDEAWDRPLPEEI